MSGIVASVNISGGGVPKLPVETTQIGVNGLSGDGHHDRAHHGGPERAVCIYSTEIIQALQAEGHPIFPGSAGENLTITGLDWSRMLPGARLKVGAAVIDIVSFTTPCKTIRDSFLDGRFNRISHLTNPGWSRVYGRVVVPGTVRAGDIAEFEGS